MTTFYRFPCDLGGDPTTVCAACVAEMLRAFGAESPEALGGVPCAGPCELCDPDAPEAHEDAPVSAMDARRAHVLHSPHPTVWLA